MSETQDEGARRYDPFRDEGRLLAAHRLVVDQGLIEPLEQADPAQLLAWHDMDLAISVEGAFGAVIDPRRLDAAARAGWIARLEDFHDGPSLEHDRYFPPYWLLHEGRRVGSICLSSFLLGPGLTPISSLYVL